MIKQFKKYAPGIAFAIGIGLLGAFLSGYINNVGDTLMALILGVIIGNFIPSLPALETGLKFTEKKVLETAIVFIGFGFELHYLIQLGIDTFTWLVVGVLFTLGIALFIGKRLKNTRALSLLLGAGNAICGSAAIAAIAPLLNAKEEEIGISLATINFLGLLGIVFLPFIAIGLSMTDAQTGILIGGTLQSLGHVVASGYSISDSIGEFAMVVKMARILLLIPLLIGLYFFQSKTNSATSSTGKVKFPLFILFFVLAVTISQFNIIPPNIKEALNFTGDGLLTISMAAIGLKIKIKPLLQLSKKAILHGGLIFLLQLIFFTLIALI